MLLNISDLVYLFHGKIRDMYMTKLEATQVFRRVRLASQATESSDRVWPPSQVTDSFTKIIFVTQGVPNYALVPNAA